MNRTKEQNAAYYLKNKERIKENGKIWRENNKDKIANDKKRYYEENKDRIREYKSNYRRINSQRIAAITRKSALKKRYGITPEEYGKMMIAQKNSCAVCLKEFTDKDRPAIDHCHNTGKVRGIIHLSCNITIGFIEKDPIRTMMALKYLITNNS